MAYCSRNSGSKKVPMMTSLIVSRMDTYLNNKKQQQAGTSGRFLARVRLMSITKSHHHTIGCVAARKHAKLDGPALPQEEGGQPAYCTGITPLP